MGVQLTAVISRSLEIHLAVLAFSARPLSDLLRTPSDVDGHSGGALDLGLRVRKEDQPAIQPAIFSHFQT